MMTSIKRKRISKKNKTAWRKTNIQDVEDFLEEQRQEERIGSFTEKADDELFIVDATPTKTKNNLLSEKQKRKLNAVTKPLRSLQALENTSKVQDPIAKRNIVRQKKSGRNIEEEVRNPTRPRHRQANKDRGLYYEKLDERDTNKNSKLKTAKDVWQDEDFRDKIPGLKDEKGWISMDLSLHIAGNVGRKVVKVHESIRHKTTKAKKFQPPHPGMSYNPSMEDHQDLLSEVVGREEKIIKEKKHLKRVTTQMFSKVTPEERDQRNLMEMTGDLNDQDHDDEDKSNRNPKRIKGNQTTPSSEVSENDGDLDNDEPYTSVGAPVENKKKSRQARNKELKQKELQRQQEAKKALRKQIADLNRIKSLKAEVLAAEEDLNQLKKRRKKTAENKKYEPKRLGRNKFVEPELDVNMPEDIAGNLRNIKMESNLITDRFKSFQKRNILPTTIAVTRKKAKVKRFLRNSHKDPGVSYQMLRDQKRAAAAQAASKPTIAIKK